MASISDLVKNALQLRPQGFNPTGKAEIHDVTVSRKSKQLIIKGAVRGSKLYPIVVIFNGMEFVDAPDLDHPLSIDLSHGNYIYCNKPSMEHTSVQVRCQCPDYYFTWQYYNKSDKALAGGAFPKYQRKTDYWPERNPLHISGYCKHVHQFVNTLKSKKFIN